MTKEKIYKVYTTYKFLKMLTWPSKSNFARTLSTFFTAGLISGVVSK